MDIVALPNRRRFFVAYALIAYFISWAIEIPLALRAQGLISADIPFSIHYLAGFGPLIAGVILTWRECGSEGLKNLVARVLKWRVEPVWWLVALSPPASFFPARCPGSFYPRRVAGHQNSRPI